MTSSSKFLESTFNVKTHRKNLSQKQEEKIQRKEDEDIKKKEELRVKKGT